MGTERMDVDVDAHVDAHVGGAAAAAGVKRKAEDGEVEGEAPAPRRIRALDPTVVNKIAAGEIIVAPVHALKEMVENAVDAGASALEIVVKDGGLKMLQITDNGCGIQKDDLAILCERHTTSKISAFEDLTSISTYGFRGEALASISHIAHLTVTTKTKDSALAWRAHYLDGALVAPKPGQSAEPRGVAGRPGTQITVEDLFFNIPTRRKAFRSHADEFNKIIDMVGRYAVHCSGVAFTCKKAGESSHTLSVQAQASPVDRIRQIHGAGIANELIALRVAGERFGFSAEGYVTNANYHIKKTTLLLFINHRAVESSALKKAVEQTYAAFLPKGGHPFLYLSLDIDPARVDVNVHPTKREVHFLNEEEIVHAVCNAIEAELAAVDTSRTFLTQTLLPGARPVERPEDDDDDERTVLVKIPPSGKRARRNSSDLVRTDQLQNKITSMFSAAAESSSSSSSAAFAAASASASASVSASLPFSSAVAGTAAAEDTHEGGGEEPLAVPEQIEYGTDDREFVQCRLKSVMQLRAEVQEEMHTELTEILSQHTFVGIVDERRRLAAIQGGVKLYLVDYGHACSEFFYQLGLTDFGNFGAIRFSPPLDLRELLRTAAAAEKEALSAAAEAAASPTTTDDVDEAFDVDAIVGKVSRQLISAREMLLEYFSLEISPAGELLSIPLLVRGYTPSVAKLPRFLLRLGPFVNWGRERECFETFLRELAAFYTPERLPADDADIAGGGGEGGGAAGQGTETEEEAADRRRMLHEVRRRRRHVRWAVEHIFFPAFRARLVSTRRLMEGGVLEVASLKGLYRVFERC